jgi:hypothetical protein
MTSATLWIRTTSTGPTGKEEVVPSSVELRWRSR